MNFQTLNKWFDEKAIEETPKTLGLRKTPPTVEERRELYRQFGASEVEVSAAAMMGFAWSSAKSEMGTGCFIGMLMGLLMAQHDADLAEHLRRGMLVMTSDELIEQTKRQVATIRALYEEVSRGVPTQDA